MIIFLFCFCLFFVLPCFLFVFVFCVCFLFVCLFVFCIVFVVVVVFFFFSFFFFLLGLNDRTVEGEFFCSDRSAVEYTNWDKLNSYYSWRSKDCACVKKDNEGRWRDQSCYYRFSYICKKPKGL